MEGKAPGAEFGKAKGRSQSELEIVAFIFKIYFLFMFACYLSQVIAGFP